MSGCSSQSLFECSKFDDNTREYKEIEWTSEKMIKLTKSRKYSLTSFKVKKALAIILKNWSFNFYILKFIKFGISIPTLHHETS